MSSANAAKMELVLWDFGFASLGITADDFLTPGRMVQLGVEPYRINLLTSISGGEFEDAWSDRVTADLGGVPADSSVCGHFARTSSPPGGPRIWPMWPTCSTEVEGGVPQLTHSG